MVYYGYILMRKEQMVSEVRNSKDTLAKLMASENLTIVHRKVPTAYFDLKNRVLCCPILKSDISESLYDLFMGHEVGHALKTPYEGYHTSHTENPTLKGYLNVIEDVRIERYIKNKYEGLRRSFHTAYDELMQIDFFGVKDRDLSEISLIDKINLITKCGDRLMIPMNEEEKSLLAMAELCETWEEVVICATKVYEYSGNNEDRNESDEFITQTYVQISDDDGDDDYESDEFDGEFETDESDSQSLQDTDSEDNSDQPQGMAQESDDSDDSDAQENDESSPEGGESAREALTEYNAHKNQDAFISEDASARTQLDLAPIFKNNNNFKGRVITYTNVLNDWRVWRSENPKLLEMHTPYISHVTSYLKNKNKKIIAHMVKEFEMRRTAMAASRATISKTGRLDMTRLAKYQIVEDVFKRVTMIPAGKNHGINVLLDWSSSISQSVPDLLEQTMILVDFCRRAQIPYRVYMFSDYDRGLCDGEGALVEIFSDEMNLKLHNEMITNMSSLWYSSFNRKLYSAGAVKGVSIWENFYGEKFYDDKSRWSLFESRMCPQKYYLGGTPLNANLLPLRCMLPEFNSRYGLEKTILTIITDGYSHPAKELNPTSEEREELSTQFGEEGPDHIQNRNIARNVTRQIIDPYTRRVYDFTRGLWRGDQMFSSTQNLLNWLSVECNVIVTGYFCVTNKRDMDTLANASKMDYDPSTDWVSIRTNGKVYSVKGYNKLFVCKTSSLATSGDDVLGENLNDASVRKITSAFKKNQKNKTSSRFLANEFIKEIA